MEKRLKKIAAVQAARCVACGSCVKVCPRGAIAVWRGVRAEVDAAACVGCGLCARACPASVIQMEAQDEKAVV